MTALLDAALAAHPRAWREKYGEVVRGTLMDVADSRGGRVPVSETLPLLLRGLWMRARSSVAFWAGLVVIAIQAVAAIRVDGYYDVDGSLTSLLLKLNEGIAYSLPLLALASGWAAARARVLGLRSASARVRLLAADDFPLVVAAAIGYSLALAIVVAKISVPWFSSPGALVAVAQAGVVLAAIAIGEVVGAVLPRVLVIFAAPAGVIATGMLVFGWLTPWNAAPWSFYPGIAYEIDVRPVVRVAVGALVLVAAAVLVVALRLLWLRAVAVLVIAIVLVVGASGAPSSPAMAQPIPRPASELICSDVEPVVCLWPEQEDAFGTQYRQRIGAMYATASELELPVDGAAPRSALRYGMTGISSIEGISGEDPEEFGLGVSGVSSDQMVNLYAAALTWGAFEESSTGDGQMVELQHSLAVVLGVPFDQTWMVTPDPYTGQRFLDPADAPNEAESRALVERWLTQGLVGVRAPS